jgi:CubicO group peptidase (beta-lactamase class C family)
MMIASDPATTAPARWAVRATASILSAIALTSLNLTTAWAAEAAMDARIQAMLPELERVVANGMKAFDMPGLAIGIVRGDRIVYAKGFGTRGKADPAPVDTRTVFQIGSVAKSFLATTMAIAVDRGTLRWDDRVVDLYPGFQFKDPWVTREFRAYDLLAQRSGLPPYVNDVLAMLATTSRN